MGVSLKIVLKSDYTRKDGTQNLRLRLTISRKVKYYPLNIFVIPKNFRNGSIKVSDSMAKTKNLLIEKELIKAKKIIFNYRLQDLPVTFDNFERDFNNDSWGSTSFYDYVERLITELNGKLAPGSLKGYKDQAGKLNSFNAQAVFKGLSDQPTNRYLKEIIKTAHINKSIGFHCSRHTFATVSKSLGMEYDVISKILGHTDIKITKVYAKYELSHLEDEMKKWE